MKIKFGFALAPAALFLLAAVAPDPGIAANCAKKPDHPSCPGGGSDDGSGNEKWRSTIVFRDAVAPPDRMLSDGADYVDGADGVEAFIGSSAKEGDILLKLQNSLTRTIHLDFADPVLAHQAGDCAAPIELSYELAFLEVDVSGGLGTPQGVYNLDGDSVMVPMRLRFIDSTGQAWFLNYGTGERKQCRSGDHPNNEVVVQEPDASIDEWTVTADPMNGSIACLEKGNTGPGSKLKFCGSYNMPFFFTVTPNTPSP